MPEQYTRKPNIKCFECRKPIYRRPVQITKSKGRLFCSPLCYGKSLRKEKPCIVCGKLILAQFNKKTCSRACANKNRTQIQYKIGRPKDKNVLIRSLKIRLLAIRGAMCERCGYNKKEILHVHHKDRNRKNNKLTNLELICPNCHYEEHYLEKSWLKDKA